MSSAYCMVRGAYIWITSCRRLQETNNRSNSCSQLLLGSNSFFRESSTWKNTEAVQATFVLVARCPLPCCTLCLAASPVTQMSSPKFPSSLSDWSRCWCVTYFCLSDYLARVLLVIIPYSSKKSWFLIWEKIFEHPIDNVKKCYSQLTSFTPVSTQRGEKKIKVYLAKHYTAWTQALLWSSLIICLTGKMNSLLFSI